MPVMHFAIAGITPSVPPQGEEQARPRIGPCRTLDVERLAVATALTVFSIGARAPAAVFGTIEPEVCMKK